MEGETQPADEGLCAPNMCGQQRGPDSNLKTFSNRRLAGKARFHRPTMVDISLLGDGGGQNYTHFSHHHPLQQQHQQLHQTTHTISSRSQRNPTSQLQHNFPCNNRPSSRVATSTSTTVGSVAPASLCLQQMVSGGTTVHRDPTYTPGRAALKHESPDCVYRISSENHLILDAFAQECSRVLTILNGGRFVEPQDPLPSSVTSHIKQEESCLSRPGGESKPDAGQVGHCPNLGKPQPRESSTIDPDDEAQHSHWSQKQTYAFLHIFTKSLQSYLFTRPQQPHPDLGLEGERVPSAEFRVSPSNNLGGWSSPAPSESYGHPSSTLPEEEEESCCPRCVELEQEMLCLQKENEELRNKLDNIPAPCQTVLDFFKTVLQHHNQFIQPMSQEQQTEEEEQTTYEICQPARISTKLYQAWSGTLELPEACLPEAV
ncbi:BEN domain-containing protein 4-like isoform X1 [Oncorhynchus keta]|uniref:BEN domain-containing protein 4-like isoform X1 n=1 Tax=Oncorhynchus keta TaxID=8018 RepID=UPI0015FB9141|nr:BEN domain-containing protein 4-like isoform X1 [Oncorhynchus keta]